MSLVNVHNEWDPLEEIIVGTMRGARVPAPDVSLHAVEFSTLESPDDIPHGPYAREIVEQTEAELDALAEALSGLGVTVRRPEPRDLSARISTPDWSTEGFYDYCPRDGLLAVGTTLIETPMVLRARIFESLAYKNLFMEYFTAGARWIAAPRPRLLDDMYDLSAAPGGRLREVEPAFDAANVLRFGTDLLYLVSDSGNELGARWLQSALGETYTVHPCRGLYASTHVDSTLVALSPGRLLVNPARVNDANMPAFLKGWEQLRCPDLVDTGHAGAHPRASTWIGMNLLVVRPGLAVVDDRQPGLIRFLERHGIDVLPLRLTHARTLGGGFHCVTLDVRRTGSLASYT
ncbi:hypothetical protein ACFWYW_41760 [Nonomuraea sp. NPDC059023]|uniref:hypothetical protein n=1 Tax=unclassified Nonomuraea TaxID=2593643 RepID=UPI0036882B8B